MLSRAERHIAPRLAIVGNAAQGLHPIAGQGFNLGLRDAMSLAEVIADRRVDGHAGRRRRGAVAANMPTGAQPIAAASSRSRTGWCGSSRRRSGVLRGMRSVGLLAFDMLPPAKSAMARLSVGAAERVPRLARGVPLGRDALMAAATQDRFRRHHRRRRHGRHLSRGIDGTRRGTRGLAHRAGRSRRAAQARSRGSGPARFGAVARVRANSRRRARVGAAARACCRRMATWSSGMPRAPPRAPTRCIFRPPRPPSRTSGTSSRTRACNGRCTNRRCCAASLSFAAGSPNSSSTPIARGCSCRTAAASAASSWSGPTAVNRSRATSPVSAVPAGLMARRAVVAHLQTEQPHRETAWQRFLPEGPIAFLPLRDGRVSLVWSTSARQRPQALQAADAEEFSERVSVASDRVLGRATLASRTRRIPARTLARARIRAAATGAGRRCGAHDSSAGGAGRQPRLARCASLVQVLAEAVARGRRILRHAHAASLRALAPQRECAGARHDRQPEPVVRGEERGDRRRASHGHGTRLAAALAATRIDRAGIGSRRRRACACRACLAALAAATGG